MRRTSTRTAFIGTPERVGDLVLDLGRVLGGGMHDHVAALLRQGERGLAFEVEMLLPADLDPALDHVGRARERRVHVALRA
jgi:hypothetical protein